MQLKSFTCNNNYCIAHYFVVIRISCISDSKHPNIFLVIESLDELDYYDKQADLLKELNFNNEIMNCVRV